MLKRNLAILIGAGLLGANVNLAVAQNAFPGGERTVKTTVATKYLNVAHEETVRIQNEQGQSFVWKADTLGEADLPLKSIAPRDFVAGQTRVFVAHPYEHTIKD